MINFVKSNGLKFEEKKPKKSVLHIDKHFSNLYWGLYSPPLSSTKTEFFPTFENVEILI